RRNLASEVAEPLGERRRFRVAVHEQELLPRAESQLGEPDLRRIEAGRILQARRRPKDAVEAVRPAMVRAADRASVARSNRQLRSSVQARVVERAQLATV